MNIGTLLLIGALVTPTIAIDEDQLQPNGDQPGTWDAVFTAAELAEARVAGGLTAELQSLVNQRLRPAPIVRHVTPPEVGASPSPSPSPSPEPTEPAPGGGVTDRIPSDWLPYWDNIERWRGVFEGVWGSQADNAMIVSFCETAWTGDPTIVNTSSGDYDLMQLNAGYWLGSFGWTEVSQAFDPAFNLSVALEIYRIQGWGAWPNCSRFL